MTVTIVILVGLALTVVALAAQPLTPSGVTLEWIDPAEPALMVVSGALLLVIASVLKKVAP